VLSFVCYLVLHKDSSRGNSLRPSLLSKSVRACFSRSISTQRAALAVAAACRCERPVESGSFITGTDPNSPLSSDVAQSTESKVQQRWSSLVIIVRSVTTFFERESNCSLLSSKTDFITLVSKTSALGNS
jgi:hypothetical protein